MTISSALIVDTETTGTDPAKDKVIEVAAIRFSIAHATPVEAYSAVLRADSQPPEAERVNGIPSAALPSGTDPRIAWQRVRAMAESSDLVLAHKADFDRSMAPEDLRSILPWVCTMDDVEWPAFSGSKSLVAIALAHGLGVSHAHRAMTDCDLISRLLTACAARGINIEAMLLRAMRPKATYRALVGYDNRQLAKDAGFRFEANTKRWLRSMAIEDAQNASLPFPIKEVQA